MMNSFRTLVSQLMTFRPCASERHRMLRTSLPLRVRVARMTSAHKLAQEAGEASDAATQVVCVANGRVLSCSGSRVSVPGLGAYATTGDAIHF
jgi:hypothetical protein